MARLTAKRQVYGKDLVLDPDLVGTAKSRIALLISDWIKNKFELMYKGLALDRKLIASQALAKGSSRQGLLPPFSPLFALPRAHCSLGLGRTRRTGISKSSISEEARAAGLKTGYGAATKPKP